MKKFLFAMVAIIAGTQFLAAQAQTQDALIGQITSAEEGAMEGVLVSAKKTGSTITISVVSDAQGRYSFPAARLEPGQYSLRIRAIGYDLDRPASVEVSGRQAVKFDINLRRTQDLAAQLTNAEWLASFPGSDQNKRALLGCIGCHSLERVARSQHKADDLVQVTLPRMQGYVNQSIRARNGITNSRRWPVPAGAPRALSLPSTICRVR